MSESDKQWKKWQEVNSSERSDKSERAWQPEKESERRGGKCPKVKGVTESEQLWKEVNKVKEGDESAVWLRSKKSNQFDQRWAGGTTQETYIKEQLVKEVSPGQKHESDQKWKSMTASERKWTTTREGDKQWMKVRKVNESECKRLKWKNMKKVQSLIEANTIKPVYQSHNIPMNRPKNLPMNRPKVLTKSEWKWPVVKERERKVWR